MSKSITDFTELLAAIAPALHAGIYAFCVVAHKADSSVLSPVATSRRRQ